MSTAKRFPPTNSNRVILGRLISSTCFFRPYYYRDRRGFPLSRFPRRCENRLVLALQYYNQRFVFVSSIAAFAFVSSCTFYVLSCLTSLSSRQIHLARDYVICMHIYKVVKIRPYPVYFRVGIFIIALCPNFIILLAKSWID